MEPIDIHELQARGAQNRQEELRLELFDRVNALGIGAQGLGGLTTVLDVKVKEYPTHAANKPVAVIPNCTATRHVHFDLDGSGVGERPQSKRLLGRSFPIQRTLSSHLSLLTKRDSYQMPR